MFERKVVVQLNEGLHARPATQFVKLARSFACEIQVLRDGKSANAKSAVKLMLLGVKEDDEILVRGEGADEATAVEALCDYAGKAAAEPAEGGAAPATPLQLAEPQAGSAPFRRGIPASGGAAVGVAFVFMPDEIAAPRKTITAAEIAGELQRLAAARDIVDKDLRRRAA